MGGGPNPNEVLGGSLLLWGDHRPYGGGLKPNGVFGGLPISIGGSQLLWGCHRPMGGSQSQWGTTEGGGGVPAAFGGGLKPYGGGITIPLEFLGVTDPMGGGSLSQWGFWGVPGAVGVSQTLWGGPKPNGVFGRGPCPSRVSGGVPACWGGVTDPMGGVPIPMRLLGGGPNPKGVIGGGPNPKGVAGGSRLL